MASPLDNYNIDADAVIDDLSSQVASLTRDNAILRGVIASMEATIVELRSKNHSHDGQDSK